MTTKKQPETNNENLDPVYISSQQFDRAVRCTCGLKKGLIDFLKQPKRITVRNFPIEMDDVIGQNIDIPAPDLYTNEQTMAWMFDTYDILHPRQNNRLRRCLC